MPKSGPKQFVDKTIRKQIELAEHLYINDGQAKKKLLKRQLHVSSLTVEKYLSDVDNMFQVIHTNGTCYSIDSLLEITSKLFKESTKLRLFKLLIFSPGKKSDFYKDNLALSDASFSRLILKLKNDLSQYQINIVVNKGYRLVSDNEKSICIIIAKLILYYDWVDDLKLYSSETIQNKFSNEWQKTGADLMFFEKDYSVYECLFLVLKMRKRQYISNEELLSKVDFHEVIQVLAVIKEETQQFIHEHWLKIQALEFMEKLDTERTIYVKQLISHIYFQKKSLSISFSTMQLRKKYFVDKFEYLNKTEAKKIDTFITKVSAVLEVDLSDFRKLMFFDLITNCRNPRERFQYDSKQKLIFCYSPLGEPINQYQFREIKNIASLIRKNFEVKKWEYKSVKSFSEDDILVTSQKFPEIPDKNQYLVNDILSPQDKTALLQWLAQME